MEILLAIMTLKYRKPDFWKMDMLCRSTVTFFWETTERKAVIAENTEQ